MGFVHFGGNNISTYFYLHLVKPDMRKVEILPQTDFWGFEISSTFVEKVYSGKVVENFDDLFLEIKE